MATNLRIGHGYDVHALREGLPLVLCGIAVPHDRGCVAYSDGDVAAHALSDALLGAAALGDIGLHFPDTCAEFRGADSMVLLRRVVEMLAERGYHIVNVDITIVMQRPKLRPFIDKMRTRLTSVLGIDVDCISVKATTEENLGFTGSEAGVAAHAVCLISD